MSIWTYVKNAFTWMTALFRGVSIPPIETDEQAHAAREVGRWRFADSINSVEWQRKQNILEQIDHFWDAMERDADSLAGREPEQLAFWAANNIHTIDREILWEVSELKLMGSNV